MAFGPAAQDVRPHRSGPGVPYRDCQNFDKIRFNVHRPQKAGAQMTTLIQRDDASDELTSTEASVEDWIGEPTLAPLDLPVAAGEQPRPTPRPDAEIAGEIRNYLRRGLQVED